MKTFTFLVLCLYLLHTNADTNPEEFPEYIYSEPQENSRCIKDTDFGGPTLFYHESDCAKYYMCVDGLAYEVTCPKDRYWSRELHTCETFEEARCSENYK